MENLNLDVLKDWMNEVSEFIENYHFEKNPNAQNTSEELSLMVEDVFRWVK